MNNYILTSTKISGHAKVCYENQALKGFEFNFDFRMNDVQYKAFLKTLMDSAHMEGYVENFEKIGMSVEKETVEVEKVTHDRIKVFCDAYKQHFGFRYEVQGYEAAKLKQNKGVKVTDELMAAYFTSDAWQIEGNYSIMNYIRHYNVVVRESKGVQAKPEFPAYYSKRFEDGLEADRKVKYWAHLRGLGFTAKKNMGKVIDWVKTETIGDDSKGDTDKEEK